MNFAKNTTETSEYTALKSFLDDKTSLDDAIDEFTSVPSSASAEDKLIRAWDALFLLACQTPTDSPSQEKLVSALIAIRHRDTQLGEIEGKQVTWSQLPLYGRQVREHWNYDEAKAQEDDEVAQMWNNANAFAARVTTKAEAFDGSDPLDFSLYAIWALRKALEDKDDVPAATVRASAMWIQYAGKELRRQSKEKRSFEGKVAKPGSKYADKEWTGFETDRWRTWGNRFANISEVAPSEEVRKVAKQTKRTFGDLAAC